MKKLISLFMLSTVMVLSVTACSSEKSAVYTKDEGSSTNITFELKAVDDTEKSMVDASIEVVGEDANLMEIMDWYFEENEINFEQENGLVETIGDLAADAENGWLLYVNDEMSDVGAADYIPADGDVAEWRYVNYAEAFPS